MAVSRPLLLVLVGTLLAAASFLAARGARETSAGEAPVLQTAAPSTDKVTPAPVKDPKTGSKPDSGPKADRGPKADGGPKADKGTPGKPANTGDRRDLPVRKSGPTAKLKVPDGVPRPVGRALARKRVVVLFFGQRGADDAFTADALKAIRNRKGVSVFRDRIERLAAYRSVTSGLGVAQAPATVVIGPDRKAQLLEGYVDAGTLRQLVVDAR